MALDVMRFGYMGFSKKALPNLSPKRDKKISECKETPNLLSTKHTRPLVISPPTRKPKFCQKEKERKGPAQKGRWRSGGMIEWRRELAGGWLRVTRPRLDCLRSRFPSYGGKGGSSGLIGKGEGRSEMEEGRGMA